MSVSQAQKDSPEQQQVTASGRACTASLGWEGKLSQRVGVGGGQLSSRKNLPVMGLLTVTWDSS